MGTPTNHGQSHYPQMEKIWNSGEPSQASAMTTHPSKYLQASLASIKVSVHDLTIRKRLGKTASMGEFQGKATADQKEHKGSSHICQKISWLSPRLLDEYSVDWWDKSWEVGTNFLEGVCPVTSGIKPTQHFIKRTSYQQSNMVVVVWWSGAALQLQDLEDLP